MSLSALHRCCCWRPSCCSGRPPADVGAAGRGRGFTPAQRAEIVAIVREALKRDPSILRDAVIALQTDDGSVKSEFRAARVGGAGHADHPNDPIGGNPHGNVTIVEFFDVRCPYCRKLEPEMASLLASDHEVRLVYKDLPILGPRACWGPRRCSPRGNRTPMRNCATR